MAEQPWITGRKLRRGSLKNLFFRQSPSVRPFSYKPARSPRKDLPGTERQHAKDIANQSKSLSAGPGTSAVSKDDARSGSDVQSPLASRPSSSRDRPENSSSQEPAGRELSPPANDTVLEAGTRHGATPATILEIGLSTPPDDSSMPLTSSSGRVGGLLIRIHRNLPKSLVYGSLIVIGALSHQTWVSGEALHFDVEIDNTSEKFVKKITVEFVRIIAATTREPPFLEAKSMTPGLDTRVLATWIWKKSMEGWGGVAPQTRILKTWTPIVPEGQATTNERGLEVSYFLRITVPNFLSKASNASIALKVIAPNSLGKLRLEQHLRHGLSTFLSPRCSEGRSPHTEVCVDQKDVVRSSSRTRPQPDEVGRTSYEAHHPETDLVRSSLEMHSVVNSTMRDTTKGNPRSNTDAFVSSSPIPCASGELLTELLSNIKGRKRVKKRAVDRQGKTAREHASQGALNDPAIIPLRPERSLRHRTSLLQPLSAIGAHSRPRSSDDVRQIRRSTPAVFPEKPAVRASFDDYIRPKPCDESGLRGKHTLQQPIKENLCRIQRLATETFEACSDEDSDDESKYDSAEENISARCNTMKSTQSTATVDTVDFERFLRERRSFQAARRQSANPFFKGSAGKERLRSSKYTGYRSLKERQEEERKLTQVLANQPHYYHRRHCSTSGGDSRQKKCHSYSLPQDDFLSKTISTATQGENHAAEDRHSVPAGRSSIQASRRLSSRQCPHDPWAYAGHRTLF